MASRTVGSVADDARAGLGVAPTEYVELVYALGVVWGFGDAVSTLLAVATTGTVAFEANPLVAALLSHDPYLLIALKAAVVLVVSVTLLCFRPTIERTPYWRPWLSAVLGLGVAVVFLNLYVAFVPLL